MPRHESIHSSALFNVEAELKKGGKNTPNLFGVCLVTFNVSIHLDPALLKLRASVEKTAGDMRSLHHVHQNSFFLIDFVF